MRRTNEAVAAAALQATNQSLQLAVEQLRLTVEQLQKSLAHRDAENATLRAALAQEHGERDRALFALMEQLRDQMGERTALLAQRDAEIAELRRKIFGRKSEKMPAVKEVLRRQSQQPNLAQRAITTAARAASREAQKELLEVEVLHRVDPAEEVCARCNGKFRTLGSGEVTEQFEYVPGHFIRKRDRRERKVCACGACIVLGPAPERVADGVRYGPGLHAHAAVSKCADSMPLYRQAKMLLRAGVSISPSTLGDIFHRTAQLLEPIAECIMKEVAASGYINADETPIRVQARSKTRTAYVWTFGGGGQLAYRYSPSRSGETPTALLASHKGYLQVDQYTGYSRVCTPEGWTRVGCLAHVRRYFFEAQQTAPEAAKEALDRILAVYRVEHDAAAKGILGSDAHRAMRQTVSKPLMVSFQEWLLEQQAEHLPKGPMGKAISYTLNAWDSLLVFLDNPRLSLDNNASERALRIIALGRKNFLFLGTDVAGTHLATLQTLVGSCELAGVNPIAYISDVLMRVQRHAAKQIAQLVPLRWKERFPELQGQSRSDLPDAAPS